MTRGRLARVPWWAWAAIVWAGGLVVAVAVWVRVMGRRPQRPTPQLDDPLYRGTDLERPPGIPDEVPDPLVYGLPGAIHALGMQSTEWGARYWLAQCARRGADADLLRRLEETWRAAQADSVRYLFTDNRTEDNEP